MMRSRTLALPLLLWCTATPAVAQSLFNAAGMGLPVEALDGRARALGNLGIGLGDASLMPTDPAAMARFRIATGIMAGQPSWVDYSQDGGPSGSFQGNRFPLVGIAYPIFSGLMSVQIGSFLDQHFTSEASGMVDLGGTSVETVDVFEQDGAVSNLNIGYARMIGERTAVGATVGRYAGSVIRTLTRSFEASLEVEPYVERGKWSYTGHSVTAGVSTDVTDGIRVAASVQIPTALDADASAETSGADGSFDLPAQYRLGANAQLAPGLELSASAAYADWSGIADDLVETVTAGSASGFGLGIELSRARLLGREAPLRFGFRRTGLPFSFGDDGASERVFSGGFGLDLNRTNDLRLAGADFALERGRRSGGGLTENFWRATVSLVLSAPN
jgi:hypothetical protein